MFVLATCEAEVQGGLLAFSALVVAVYGVWLWAAVLRRPDEAGGRPYMIMGLGALVGVPMMWPALDGNDLYLLLLAAGIAAAAAATVAIVGQWQHMGRLIASGVLGALTPATLITLFLTIGIGSGGFCFD